MTGTVLAVLAAALGPLAAYIVAARRFSGKIETSDAKELWQESRSIRDWSQARIRELNRVIAAHEATIAQLREEVQSCKAQVAAARARVAALERGQRDRPS